MIDFEKFVGDLEALKNHGGSSKRLNHFDPRDQKKLKQASQDLVLLNNTGRRLFITNQLGFVNYFNVQPDGVKHLVDLIRPYWLGLPNTFEQPLFDTASQVQSFITERLVADLVEMVSSWRLNFDRNPVPIRKKGLRSFKGYKSRPYREWFKDHFAESTYTYDVVIALAEDKPLTIPRKTELWGMGGELLSEEEELLVRQDLSADPKPKLLQFIESVPSDLWEIKSQARTGLEELELRGKMQQLEKEIESLKNLKTSLTKQKGKENNV